MLRWFSFNFSLLVKQSGVVSRIIFTIFSQLSLMDLYGVSDENSYFELGANKPFCFHFSQVSLL